MMKLLVIGVYFYQLHTVIDRSPQKMNFSYGWSRRSYSLAIEVDYNAEVTVSTVTDSLNSTRKMNFLPFAFVACFSTTLPSICRSNGVPVVAWGNGLMNFKDNASTQKILSDSGLYHYFLEKLTQDESTTIVAFIEESLGSEDLGPHVSDENDKYPLIFKTMLSGVPSQYISSVKNPVEALEALDNEINFISPSELLHSSSVPSKKLFLVKLDDAIDGESRLKLLRRHDEDIHKWCSEVQRKNENTVCILTAKYNAWGRVPEGAPRSVRKLLQTDDPVETTETIDRKDVLNVYYLDHIGMVYTKDLPTLIFKNINKVINLTLPTNPTIVKGKENEFVCILESAVSANDRVRLTFSFVLPNLTSTWQLNTVRVKYPANSGKSNDSTLRATSYIGASIGNSFHSPSNVAFESDDYALTFKGLQAQYFGISNPRCFGPAEDSVYFFTIPILSGLFVMSALVPIILLGLTMIFDIKTMDQFDDPKGKSITINASE